MGAHTNNVVSISGRGRDPGQRIIEECHDRLTKHLVEWLRSVDQVIAEELFLLADQTNDRLQQTRYLDLRDAVQKKWPELTAAFNHSFNEKNKAGQEIPLSIPDFDGLSLVEDATLSESIVLREFAARLAETCNEELYGLDRRVGVLLNEENIDKFENPLGTTSICQALAESCHALASKVDDRVLLLRRLEKHLHTVQPGIYQDINQRLIDFGVLPELKRSFKKTATVNTAAATGAASPLTPPPEQQVTLSEGSILGALQRLVAARTEGTGGASSTPGQAYLPPGGSPSTTSFPGNQPTANAGFNTANGAPTTVDASAVSQTFFASLDQFQHAGGDATVNQIQLIRATEAARNVGHVEAVTIDIVAMLFDFIFNDQNIPNGVKALVGRLQIPVLKLAMLDQTFFGNRNHPARRFLDEISGIALRWGGNIDLEDPFYIVLAKLIERIHDEFASDVEIFGRALDELQAFVEQREEEEETTTKIASEVAARREREAAAWERANAAVREATLEAVPAVIAEFFRQQWVEVLQRIAARGDGQDQAWQDAVKLMGDLAHSVLPKKTPVERMALISTLPNLLARINKGLDIVNADKNERRLFFDALVDLHTTALRGDPPVAKPAAKPLEAKPDTSPKPVVAAQPEARKELPALEISGAKPGIDSNETGDIIVTRSISNGVEVEEITLVGAKPAWRADHRQAAGQVAELKRGDWVEFNHDDGTTTRERLTWMSPRRHLLVFSNHRAAKAISIAPDALARRIRQGQATVVAEASIFDRAMNGVLETLNTA